MKKSIALLGLITLFSVNLSYAQCAGKSAKDKGCAGETTCQPTKSNGDKIEVYYFHLEHRCTTCETVQRVASESLIELYGTTITLQVFNLDDKKNDALAKKLGVSGQTLLVVNGEKKIDLTNDAFMFANSKPEKLKEKLKKAIDSFK